MDLVEKDLKYIWHPCSQMKDYEELPPIIVDRARRLCIAIHIVEILLHVLRQ